MYEMGFSSISSFLRLVMLVDAGACDPTVCAGGCHQDSPLVPNSRLVLFREPCSLSFRTLSIRSCAALEGHTSKRHRKRTHGFSKGSGCSSWSPPISFPSPAFSSPHHRTLHISIPPIFRSTHSLASKMPTSVLTYIHSPVLVNPWTYPLF